MSSIQSSLRSVRAMYDKMSNAAKASIRGCRTSEDLRLTPAFCRLLSAADPSIKSNLHQVVLYFPLAEQKEKEQERFYFGAYIRKTLGPEDKAPGVARRFGRVIQCDQYGPRLETHLYDLFRYASSKKAPVDWGQLGYDILRWDVSAAERENGTDIRRRWLQHYYGCYDQG